MDLYKLAWLVWIGGTILIVLSWNDTVSAEVGWVGFVIALIGVALSFIPHLRAKQAMPPPNLEPPSEAERPDAEPGAAADGGRDPGFLEFTVSQRGRRC